ncbi:hypothetical protein Ciccas_004654 [Cichlidogyrus casuarinus]|uniref:Uncharacterized protein n=1 Tax=Cichlidogyrus casuarinus TaxID=1844966 RepID=A0ABD2QBT5_9PLAT
MYSTERSLSDEFRLQGLLLFASATLSFNISIKCVLCTFASTVAFEYEIFNHIAPLFWIYYLNIIYGFLFNCFNVHLLVYCLSKVPIFTTRMVEFVDSICATSCPITCLLLISCFAFNILGPHYSQFVPFVYLLSCFLALKSLSADRFLQSKERVVRSYSKCCMLVGLLLMPVLLLLLFCPLNLTDLLTITALGAFSYCHFDPDQHSFQPPLFLGCSLFCLPVLLAKAQLLTEQSSLLIFAFLFFLLLLIIREKFVESGKILFYNCSLTCIGIFNVLVFFHYLKTIPFPNRRMLFTARLGLLFLLCIVSYISYLCKKSILFSFFLVCSFALFHYLEWQCYCNLNISSEAILLSCFAVSALSLAHCFRINFYLESLFITAPAIAKFCLVLLNNYATSNTQVRIFAKDSYFFGFCIFGSVALVSSPLMQLIYLNFVHRISFFFLIVSCVFLGFGLIWLDIVLPLVAEFLPNTLISLFCVSSIFTLICLRLWNLFTLSLSMYIAWLFWFQYHFDMHSVTVFFLTFCVPIFMFLLLYAITSALTSSWLHVPSNILNFTTQRCCLSQWKQFNWQCMSVLTAIALSVFMYSLCQQISICWFLASFLSMALLLLEFESPLHDPTCQVESPQFCRMLLEKHASLTSTKNGCRHNSETRVHLPIETQSPQDKSNILLAGRMRLKLGLFFSAMLFQTYDIVFSANCAIPRALIMIATSQVKLALIWPCNLTLFLAICDLLRNVDWDLTQLLFIPLCLFGLRIDKRKKWSKSFLPLALCLLLILTSSLMQSPLVIWLFSGNLHLSMPNPHHSSLVQLVSHFDQVSKSTFSWSAFFEFILILCILPSDVLFLMNESRVSCKWLSALLRCHPCHLALFLNILLNYSFISMPLCIVLCLLAQSMASCIFALFSFGSIGYMLNFYEIFT